jgi:hypothetical protein
MQTTSVRSISLPVAHAARIAQLLERCAAHEEERLHGRVTFPLVVMTELAVESHQWARYLQGVVGPGEET